MDSIEAYLGNPDDNNSMGGGVGVGVGVISDVLCQLFISNVSGEVGRKLHLLPLLFCLPVFILFLC